MIRKSRFSMIRGILYQAKRLDLKINRQDKRLSYLLQSHVFFVWNSEEEFNYYIIHCLSRLQSPERKKSFSQKLTVNISTRILPQ